MGYTIIISEPQRKRIESSLKLLDRKYPLTENELKDPNLEFLLDCIKRLPDDEKENPGIVHGVCL